MLRNIAEADGITVEHWLPQDPGSAGKAYATALVNMLSGHNARFSPETGDKVTRFSAFSAQAEAGNVCVLRAPWNQRWFETLEAFPEAQFDRAFALNLKAPFLLTRACLPMLRASHSASA